MPEMLEMRAPGREKSSSSTANAAGIGDAAPSAFPPTLFDRCWRQYALCREHLFTDHTRQIVRALGPLLESAHPRSVVEAGCGPGFYSRRLAALFPQLQVTGIDLSEPLLYRARVQAHQSGLNNCKFIKADALSLGDFPDQVDAVIASRLFLILADPAVALSAIFAALRPGGLCFIAEPTSLLHASIPLLIMKATERLGKHPNARAPLPQSRVLSVNDFESLVETQPWRSIRIWNERGYQCAVCRKAA